MDVNALIENADEMSEDDDVNVEQWTHKRYNFL